MYLQKNRVLARLNFFLSFAFLFAMSPVFWSPVFCAENIPTDSATSQAASAKDPAHVPAEALAPKAADSTGTTTSADKTSSIVPMTSTAPASPDAPAPATPALAASKAHSAPAAAPSAQSTAKDPEPIQMVGGVNLQVCSACHGKDGNSPAPAWPKIAGLSENYLLKQLLEYKKGEKGHRFDPTMYGMVQNLSDQDLADLAAYFASQKETPGTAEDQFVALGEKIYRGGNSKTGVPACIACHGPKGEGNSLANFPKISSQYAEYTADQLKKFKSGARSNDPNSIMRDIAKRMSDEEIQAVSSYVSGLH